MYKNHLLKGVAKGAMTLEQADAKFQTWLDEKHVKISSKKKEIELGVKDEHKKRMEDEIKVNEAKAAAIAKKLNKVRLDEAAKAAEAGEAAKAAADAILAAKAAEAMETAPVEEVAEPEVTSEVAPEIAAETAVEPAPETTEETPKAE